MGRPEIARQMAQIETTLADPAKAKGRVNSLKAAHRKLYNLYLKTEA
jgi:hypothetical protein